MEDSEFAFFCEFVCVADGGHGVAAVAVSADFVSVVLGHDGAADDDAAVRLLLVELPDGFLHVHDGGRHEGGEADEADVLSECGLHDGFRRHILSEVDDVVAVVFEQDLHDVFSDAALILIFQFLFLLIPGTILIVFFVWKWRHRTFTWKDLGNRIIDIRDGLRKKSRREKEKWENF